MFNNLGIGGGRLVSPVFKKATIFRRVPFVIPYRAVQSAGVSLGGNGNDVINIGNGATGATGPIGPQGATGATGSIGPQGATGPQGLLSPVPVTIIDTSPYIALTTDYFLGSTIVDGVIVLPTDPPPGTIYIVKDITGIATNANPIVITDSNTFDGSITAEIQTNYGSLTFIFNGTEWNII